MSCSGSTSAMRRRCRACSTRCSSPPGRRPAGCAADALELARAQQREQLALAPTHPDAGDAALLELVAGAGEVVDDLLEVRVVPDDEDPLLVAAHGQQLERVLHVELRGELVVHDEVAG